VHVIASYLGFAGFNTAFGVAIAYLIQERQVKSGRLGGIAYLLPPLDALDRLAAWLTGAAVGVVGLGILSGMGFAHATSGTWWVQEPKATATLVSWCIYVVALLLRRFAGWRGRKMAWMLVGGFVLVLVTFAGISHVLPSTPPIAG
jgi:ABC-type transport system involved in cytochrome c biogenesis permease subunit